MSKLYVLTDANGVCVQVAGELHDFIGGLDDAQLAFLIRKAELASETGDDESEFMFLVHHRRYAITYAAYRPPGKTQRVVYLRSYRRLFAAPDATPGGLLRRWGRLGILLVTTWNFISGFFRS